MRLFAGHFEFDRLRVEAKPAEVVAMRAVTFVPDQGVPRIGELDADLMLAPRSERKLEEA